MTQPFQFARNLLLLAASLGMLLVCYCVNVVTPYTAAEAISEELGPQIDIDVGLLRRHLTVILNKHVLNKTIIDGFPWAMLSVYFGSRVVAGIWNNRIVANRDIKTGRRATL